MNTDVEREVLDDEPRSILLGIMSQLTTGMDLHRVTLPTFVLEPRSMLERITDFMSHPDILLRFASTSLTLQCARTKNTRGAVPHGSKVLSFWMAYQAKGVCSC